MLNLDIKMKTRSKPNKETEQEIFERTKEFSEMKMTRKEQSSYKPSVKIL